MFPWAIVYLDEIGAGHGLPTFLKMAVFIGILFLGLVYAWAKGDLDWVKPRPAFTAADVVLPPQAHFKRHVTPSQATTPGA
jgi:NADH-quinone oxidoreductase subunit A